MRATPFLLTIFGLLFAVSVEAAPCKRVHVTGWRTVCNTRRDCRTIESSCQNRVKCHNKTTCTKGRFCRNIKRCKTYEWCQLKRKCREETRCIHRRFCRTVKQCKRSKQCRPRRRCVRKTFPQKKTQCHGSGQNRKCHTITIRVKRLVCTPLPPVCRVIVACRPVRHCRDVRTCGPTTVCKKIRHCVPRKRCKSKRVCRIPKKCKTRRVCKTSRLCTRRCRTIRTNCKRMFVDRWEERCNDIFFLSPFLSPAWTKRLAALPYKGPCRSCSAIESSAHQLAKTWKQQWKQFTTLGEMASFVTTQWSLLRPTPPPSTKP